MNKFVGIPYRKEFVEILSFLHLMTAIFVSLYHVVGIDMPH